MIVSSPAPPAAAPPLPAPRGPLSGFLLDRWRGPARPLTGAPPVRSGDPLADDDVQLALYLCYELHYRSFAGVDDGWEWEPSLLDYRRRLERPFEAALRDLAHPADRTVDPGEAAAALRGVVTGGGGPSLSTWFEESGTEREFAEFAVHRSAYQLKEADPHTWVIPRLAGTPKAACVEIQSDEYGGGREPEMHATLFAAVLDALGLDSTYGAYVDRLPGVTLATVNLISFFGLHRRWRGALVGHLAGFEMTSVAPMARYAATVDRLGLPPAARRFYAVHVTADAHHAVVAADGLVGGLALREPELVPDILLGARALAALEGRFTAHLLAAWTAGRSSLRPAGAPR
ncbi:MAG TPA: iron-containing redox enzyme family protein [Acidimicrobiia bacterium]|nr:iron-containing redox enzyme family protein [Acidimicrobiia bacterium]